MMLYYYISFYTCCLFFPQILAFKNGRGQRPLKQVSCSTRPIAWHTLLHRLLSTAPNKHAVPVRWHIRNNAGIPSSAKWGFPLGCISFLPAASHTGSLFGANFPCCADSWRRSCSLGLWFVAVASALSGGPSDPSDPPDLSEVADRVCGQLARREHSHICADYISAERLGSVGRKSDTSWRFISSVQLCNKTNVKADFCQRCSADCFWLFNNNWIQPFVTVCW